MDSKRQHATNPEETNPGAELEKSPQLSHPEGVDRDMSSIAIGGALSRPSDVQPGGRSRAAKPQPAAGSGQGGGVDDAQVMLQVREGDDNAFNYLVERYRRPMIGYMYRMVHNAAIAEELAQEVFLRVYRSRGSYSADAKFTTWLYRIATNLAVNHARDHKHDRPEEKASLDEVSRETGQPIDVADGKPSVEQKLMREEKGRAIRRRVDALPERQRLAVTMHKYQELDYRQIAQVLKISESATKSLLFRAYQTLRTELKEFL
jgi:RNA polymerase sigma-70 factor (ECF subfamily)